MTALELLVAIATGQGAVMAKTRRMIGEGELALLIAKAALASTSIALSPTKVAEELGITPQGAAKKIDNAAIQEPKKTP